MKASPILLVEDDINDVFFFERAVKKAAISHQVQVARDGLEAIHYLSGEGDFANREKYPLPCLIVLDLNMPRKNGFEVLEWLRQTQPLNTLPAVILTSSQAERDSQQAHDLGARAYFVKPSDPSKLVELINQMTKDCVGPQRSPQ
jgi:CheY-like chemotaxis protein